MSAAASQTAGLSRDFWTFWAGQTISNLGNAITFVALPLLVYNLSGSALNLALTTAAEGLPYLLFGLLIGAWVDRVERKRLMVLVDLGRAFVLGTIPLLAAFDALSVWWVYGVAFITSTLTIAFNAAEFAAIPSLVEGGDLVTANGRIQASYSAAFIVGPLIGGVMLAVMTVEWVIVLDSLTFVASAFSLLLVRRPFNAAREGKPISRIREDVVAGLRFVWHHPVLRSISIMMLLVNFVDASVNAQFVLFAGEQLDASDSQIGLLFAAGGAGVVVTSLLAGRMRRRWPFSRVALGALMVFGAMTIVLSLLTSLAMAGLVWAVIGGTGVLFNINTGSLRQSITPNEMLGRVITIAGVMAVAFTPLGSLAGGLVIERTGNISLVFGVIGVLIILIAVAFTFSPLGHAEDYLPTASGITEAEVERETATIT